MKRRTASRLASNLFKTHVRNYNYTSSYVKSTSSFFTSSKTTHIPSYSKAYFSTTPSIAHINKHSDISDGTNIIAVERPLVVGGILQFGSLLQLDGSEEEVDEEGLVLRLSVMLDDSIC
eukprot:TRINITY_DN507_c0_g1_i1.p1 TRINITY_DN507_c0_g1~~TRINITY_DN507_c0_g1_i1.p1  ORF type:complete len:119 (-),score=14.93 TRINITY_DN507_c0_g1_i1:85-441(-)